MGRRLVLGDIHGAHKALIQVLERSKFDYENDLLIIIGDVCDGWPETRKCVLDVVNQQAENEGLWFIAVTAPEHYLQLELMRLHQAVEHYFKSKEKTDEKTGNN